MGIRSKSSPGYIRYIIPIYMSFLFVLAVGIVLMPIGNSIKESTPVVTYVSGAAFWLGIIGTVTTAVWINRCRKKLLRSGGKSSRLKQLGLVHFFRNKEAAAMDISMFVSVIGFIVAKVFADELVVSFVFLALTIFSFGMHCMLNGINYIFIKQEVRRDEKS